MVVQVRGLLNKLIGQVLREHPQAVATDDEEMFRHLPWPFPDGAFPRQLGAVVQVTVLHGEMPALLVVHDKDGDWLVGDGINDPNLPGASVATHIWHAIERNGSIKSLANLPPGSQATRRWPGDSWVVSEARLLD